MGNNSVQYFVEFAGHGTWKLWKDRLCILEAYLSDYFESFKIDPIQALKSIFEEVFPNKTFRDLKNVWTACFNPVKGTVIVISAIAKEEANRLSKRCTRMKECQITETFFTSVTKIDGAIQLDEDFNCHAIGVILDGIVQEWKGDASRGSRYNSSLTYLYCT